MQDSEGISGTGIGKEKDMGMYTEFIFNASLKKDCPNEIIDILNYMVDGIKVRDNTLLDNKLFMTARWEFMLRSGSSYFDAQPHSMFIYDDICGKWIINVQCNLKNYDNEIEKFVAWIKPYLDKTLGDFLGYSRYEETQIPTLLYM